jgi:hypothetical protein
MKGEKKKMIINVLFVTVDVDLLMALNGIFSCGNMDLMCNCKPVVNQYVS